MAAIKGGVARIQLTRQEVYDKTMADIREARAIVDTLMEKGFIRQPDEKLLADAVEKAVAAVK